MVTANKFETEVGRTGPQTKYGEEAQRYQARFLAQVHGLAEQLSHACAESADHGDLIKRVEGMPHANAALLRDAWDPNLRGDDVVAIFTGSGSVVKRVEREPRDRAIVSVLLRQEHSEAIVAVNDKGRMVADFKVGFGVAGGVPGGVAGGATGGVVDGVQGLPMADRNFEAVAMAPPPAAPMPMLAMNQMVEVTGADVTVMSRNTATLVREKDEAGAAPRVRSYFPEALYINPEIITDKDGVASITIPLADSITTWRMAMMASTPPGPLGGGTASMKEFQDFFVDLDLPVTLTQGDRVSIPVAVYNHSGTAGEVKPQPPGRESVFA